LADALAAEGLDVVTCDRGRTSSHHIAVDVRSFGGGAAAARTLAASNILLSEIGLPGPDHDPAGAIRIGTQTIASQGFRRDDMPVVAGLITASLCQRVSPSALREEASRLRRVPYERAGAD
jgi:glycine hydroxymethyltransferase